MSGKDILGCSYSASCETLRKAMKSSKEPKVGNCVFFSGSRHSGANHIGIVYKVDSSKIYTIEGNTSSGSTVIDNGGAVAKKSYSRSYDRILGYGVPNFTSSYTADMLVKIAEAEVGYLEKNDDKYLNEKEKGAGDQNRTKYGKFLGMNGQYWCASFVCWCFDQLGKATPSKTTTSSKTTSKTTTTSTKKTYSGTYPSLTIQKGAKGDDVKNLQKYLKWYGCNITVDGIAGNNTVAAIRYFERAEKLTIDGVWGVKCLQAAKKVKR